MCGERMIRNRVYKWQNFLSRSDIKKGKAGGTRSQNLGFITVLCSKEIGKQVLFFCLSYQEHELCGLQNRVWMWKSLTGYNGWGDCSLAWFSALTYLLTPISVADCAFF